MAERALFLDRDGTLVHPRHYPTRPDQLRLYDGIGPALADCQAAGFRLVVITNQSGLARGYFDVPALDRMHAHIAAELDRHGVHLAGIYYCPHHPEGVIADLALSCDCRKPAPGLLLRAARELDLDLARSWFVGDILDDVEAGNRAGCRTVLVDLGTEAAPAGPVRRPDFVARGTVPALRLIMAVERRLPVPDARYVPPSWTRSPAALNGTEAVQ